MTIAIGLLKVLLELGRSKKTGAFVAESGGTRVRLFVENGEIVQAEDGGVAETLGRILLREEVVTQQQYDEALAAMAAQRAKGKHVKLGEVMISLGFLTRDGLEDALEAQVRKKAVRALGWPRANVSFMECHGGELVVTARHPMAIEPLVLDALRAAPRSDIEQLFAQAKDRYVALRSEKSPGGGAARQGSLAVVASFDASDEETAFAASLDGTHKAADLLAAGDDGHAAVLAALLLTDCLDLHAAPQASGAAKLPARTTGPTVRPAQRGGPKLRKRSDKEPGKRAAEPVPAPPQGDIETPATPQAPMARVLAEQSFQNGKRLVRQNQMKDAAPELKRAAALFDAPEYQLWAAYAEMRIDPKGETTHFLQLTELANRALAEDPECGFAYFVLGHLALRTGEKPRALEMFERARALDKDVEEARTSEPHPEVSIAKSSPSLKLDEEGSPVPAPRPAPEDRVTPAPPSSASGNAALAKEIIAAAKEPAPPPASAGTAPKEAAPPAPRSNNRYAIAAVAVAAVAIGAFVALRKPAETPRPEAPPPAAASAPPVASAPPSAAASPSPSAAPLAVAADASDEASADIELDTPGDAPAPSTDAGTLEFPDAAEGHRVFMDGKTLGEPVPTDVPCGAHVVRIGGKGRDQRVDVPCGGHVLVPYP